MVLLATITLFGVLILYVFAPDILTNFQDPENPFPRPFTTPQLQDRGAAAYSYETTISLSLTYLVTTTVLLGGEPRLAATPLPFSLPSAPRTPGPGTRTPEVVHHARRTRCKSAARSSAYAGFLWLGENRVPASVFLHDSRVQRQPLALSSSDTAAQMVPVE